MEKKQLTYPPKGAGKKLTELFERDRKKEPSDELVKIISEYGTPAPENKPAKKDDRAAKDVEV